jgi:hypothetical protein
MSLCRLADGRTAAEPRKRQPCQCRVEPRRACSSECQAALYDLLGERYSPGRAEREYLGILALGLEHRLEHLEEAIGVPTPTHDGQRHSFFEFS